MSDEFFINVGTADPEGPWRSVDATVESRIEKRLWWTHYPPNAAERAFCVARLANSQKWVVLRYMSVGEHIRVAGPFDTWQQALAAAKVMA